MALPQLPKRQQNIAGHSLESSEHCVGDEHCEGGEPTVGEHCVGERFVDETLCEADNSKYVRRLMNLCAVYGDHVEPVGVIGS